MAKKNLVIVESPAKAQTIKKILGANYEITASFGHIRDLPKSKIGVDIENNFEPNYMAIRGKGDITKKLRDLAKKADKVYLASDMDREGEAIAWHLAHILKLDLSEKNRIEFNAITKEAIKDAVKNPRAIDMDRVDAQQARRILDRLVGYQISPLLWKAVDVNTSAGRVQSAALKLICDLEDEIKAFIVEKYWEINGDFEGGFNFSLNRIDETKVSKIFDFEVVQKLKKEISKKTFEVISANINKKSSSPPKPLKTSTLQQLASSYLGFSASKTMRVAQGLYEGVEIDGTSKGLITYMRTDSLRLSPEAKEMAKEFILKKYGEKYWGNPKEEKNSKSQKIQDAHEAIRPTDAFLIPDEIKKFLNDDQYKLYKLIWERFIISQFSKMEYEQFEILTAHKGYEFRGVANKITFDGYYKIFKDEDEIQTNDFPSINVGDKMDLLKLNIVEGETKPPARLTESSLVKKLEADGIGRPSTYASIIDTLKKREYVLLDGKKFVPTDLGYRVKKVLEENFPNIMNIKFTAEMEEKLDSIEEGDLNWKKVLKEFYDDLEKYLKVFSEKAEELKNRRVESDVVCHGPMVMKTGRFGKYLLCENEECAKKISLKGIKISEEEINNGYINVKEIVEEKEKARLGEPTDLYTKAGKLFLLKLGRFGSYLESEDFANDEIRESLPTEIRKMLAQGTVERKDGIVQLKKIFDEIKAEEKAILDKAGKCEKCGKPFEVKRGRWGKFLACTGYPECKNIRKLGKEEKK
ncbi:MAG: type I DNA topoisomerase [Fusobacteriaceae bacterium]|nr:type I DNA topoisomerase [Fusobacteriaceae bacterium]MBN2839206.1 type I DNA topoisomerase [Fusobacteriaceae bacterium]